MEILARERAESEKAALEQRVRELQDQLEQRATQDRASEEPGSQLGSNMCQNLV
jgi:BMFP domain-containing protein YqiC